MNNTHISKIELTRPFWLSLDYRRALLKDSFNYFMRFITNITDLAESQSSIVKSLRLLRNYAERRILCRHLVKHETIWEILRTERVKVVVEIGSFDGLDALEFGRMFPDAQIFAFEADPSNYELLKKNVEIRKNVTPVPKAVFNFTGQGTFHASNGEGAIDHVRSSGSMLIPTSDFKETFSNIKFDQDFSVETVTMFDWAQQNDISQIDLIWMDAQGAELHILEGMQDLLNRTKVIFLEVWQDCYYEGGGNLDEIENFLRIFGYQKTHIWLEGNIGDALFQRKG